jgi:hypothetical protein
MSAVKRIRPRRSPDSATEIIKASSGAPLGPRGQQETASGAGWIAGGLLGWATFTAEFCPVPDTTVISAAARLSLKRCNDLGGIRTGGAAESRDFWQPQWSRQLACLARAA